MRSIFFSVITIGAFVLVVYTLLVRKDVEITSFNEVIKQFSSPTMENILDLAVGNNSIFFLETSFQAFEHGVVQINKRAACALESAALHHKNREVYMVYIFPNKTKDVQILDNFLTPLSVYPNVHVVYALLGDYIKDTPVENLYKTSIIDKSPYWINHHSDILRMVTLLKFGGIYMDSDVVVLKSFDPLGENFIALEVGSILANGVIGFGKHGFGHDFLELLLEDVSANYKPDVWSANGPMLFTRWAQELCNSTHLDQFNECVQLKILPPKSFYPIYGTVWEKLFDENSNDEVFKSAKNSYLVHFWNKLSAGRRLYLDSKASYLLLAKENCPKVYSHLYKTF